MAKKTMGKLFIPRGDGFDLDFATYQKDERFEKVRVLMNDRRFTVGGADVSYRVVNHWDQTGLFPEGVKGDGGWRKFTLPELVWLHVIRRLREFGLPLEKIVQARKDVMDWRKEHQKYVYFEYYVAKAWASKTDPYVFILSNGSAGVASGEEIENSRMFNDNFDVLLISLKSILDEMGLDAVGAERLFSLTEEEIELLAELRSGRNNEVRAKINPNKEITEIETTSTVTKSIHSHEIKHGAKKEKMYGRVVTQYEDGVPKSVQVTRRQKFKK